MPAQHDWISRAAEQGLTHQWTEPGRPKIQQLGVVLNTDSKTPSNGADFEVELQLEHSKESKMQGLPLLPNSSCCTTWVLPHPWHQLCSSWLHWNNQDLNQDIKMKFLMSNLEITFPFSTPRDTPFPVSSAPHLIFNTSFMHPWQFLIQLPLPKRSPHYMVKDTDFWLPAASRTLNTRGNGISKAGCSWEMQ